MIKRSSVSFFVTAMLTSLNAQAMTEQEYLDKINSLNPAVIKAKAIIANKTAERAKLLKAMSRVNSVTSQRAESDSQSYDDDFALGCDVTSFGQLGQNFKTGCTNIDASNKKVRVYAFYHPDWLANSVTKGVAYEWLETRVAIMNETLANSVGGSAELAGFGTSISVDAEGMAYDDDVVNDEYVQGWAGAIQPYLYNDEVITEFQPERQEMDEYGADWATIIRPSMAYDTGLCGASGAGSALAIINANDANNTQLCQNVFAHEFGHTVFANHEDRTSKADGNGTAQYANRAATCGNQNTVMWHSITTNDLRFFSSPDKSNGGETCGDDTHNNQHYVENWLPYMSNIAGEMEVFGDVHFSANAPISVEQGNSFTLTVERDGDTSKVAKVAVFMRGATHIFTPATTDNLNVREYLDSDYVDVDFNAGQSSVTLTFNAPVTDYATYAEIPAITAELVVPKNLKVTGDKINVSVTAPQPEDTGSGNAGSGNAGSGAGNSSSGGSSGGSMGFLSLLPLVWLGYKRRK